MGVSDAQETLNKITNVAQLALGKEPSKAQLEELTPIIEALGGRDVTDFFEPAFGAIESALVAQLRSKTRATYSVHHQTHQTATTISSDEEEKEEAIPAKRQVEELAGRHE